MKDKLKNKYNIKYIAYLIDPIEGIPFKRLRDNIAKTEKELVFSFDYKDAKKNNYIYAMNFFSVVDFKRAKEKIDNSVFFIGRDKGRSPLINSIYKELTSKDIECRFILDKVDKENRIEGITYDLYYDYSDMLSEMDKYSCILEILQPGQRGASLRYYEAIAYNKKLITNNKNVKDLPYYDEKRVYLLEEGKGMDEEWIKNKVEINNNYNNEFSPINFLNQIREEVEKK